MSAPQLVAVGLAMVFTSALPRSWQQFSLILMKGGFYADSCDANAPIPSNGGARCLAQEKQVGDLLAIYFAAWSAGGLMAGPCMDKLGPKLTAMLGEGFTLALIIALAFSKLNPIATTAIIFCLGLSCNFILYVSFVFTDYHPKRPALVIGFVSASMYLGQVIAPIMYTLWNHHPNWSFQNIWLVYALCITLPCGLGLIWAAPWKRPQLEDAADDNNPANFTEAAIQQGVTPELTATDVHKQSLELVADDSRQGVDTNARVTNLKDNLSFAKAAIDLDFQALTWIGVVQSLLHVYYPTIVRQLSGIEVSDTMGWEMMAQGAFCLLLGYVGDFFTSGTMALFYSIMTCLVFILALVPSTGLQYLTTILFVIANSSVYNPRFTGCRVFCPKRHLGSLMGLAGAIQGVIELLNIPIARSTSYNMWLSILAGLCFLTFPIGPYLSHREQTIKKVLNAIDASKTTEP